VLRAGTGVLMLLEDRKAGVKVGIVTASAEASALP